MVSQQQLDPMKGDLRPVDVSSEEEDDDDDDGEEDVKVVDDKK